VEYLQDGGEKPSDMLQIIDIVLRNVPMLKSQIVTKSRCMFPAIANKQNAILIPDAREVWHGIHQSARISHWKSLGSNALTLNIDISYSVVMRGGSLTDLMGETEGPQRLEESIKHLTFECEGQFYKFDKFDRYDVGSARIMDKDGREVNMVDYYRQMGKRLQDTRAPTVVSTAKSKPPGGRGRPMPKKFPPELCFLLPGQKPKVEKDVHKAHMIRASAEDAPTRLAEINRFVNMEELYPSDVTEFGLKLDKKPMEAEGRVLDAPELLGGDDKEIKVQNGEFRSGKFAKPIKLQLWGTILIEDRESRNPCRDSDFANFGRKFMQIGQEKDCEVKEPIMQETVRDFVSFQELMEKLKANNRDPAGLQMIMICGKDRGSDDYQAIKTLCELNYGVMTQFVKAKNVLKAAPDMITNLWLKVNEKLGGTNWKVSVPLPNSENPIMVVGCSFSHSEPGSTEPTIVGFSATTQQGATGYINYTAHQDPRLNIVTFRVMEEALMHFVKEFMARNNGSKPERIFWFRGGASEGALQAIMKNEMEAIRRIFQQKDPSYQPAITFVVSIRNHRQKMFAVHEKDQVGQGKNVPAGTVMSGYGGGAPGSFHYHLASHAGVGTINPTFYQVLHDDNDIELDNMVKLTYALSLDSKRCEKSISEVAPVRLASLRAERARNHWQGSKKLIESSEIDNRGMKDHLSNDENKLATRSMFKKNQFFI